MPELPEVECVRRGLRRAKVEGRRIDRIWRSKLLLRTGAFWRNEQLHLLRGGTTGALQRRGKFLLWHVESAGSEAMGLVVHLGMTGRVVVHPAQSERAPHTHLVLSLAELELHFVDARRFGGVRADRLVSIETEGPIAALGPEPLQRGFHGNLLAQRAQSSTRALRDVLLDQRVVAGLGNIYVSEALFVARLDPLRRALSLSDAEWETLGEAVVSVLRQGLRNGGTSFRDYRGARGQRGRNQDALWVYGRGGHPCRVCKGLLLRYEHGGRSGVLCPSCQSVRTRLTAE